MNKLEKLKKILKKMNSVLVAYSGGVDSSFLLKVAKDVLKDKVLAVTATSEIYPKEELKFSKEITKQWGIKHKIIKTNELKDKNFMTNSFDRCYFCKKELFSCLRDIAKKFNLNFVLDGSNLSDKKDFRPGQKARIELKIRSPLQEVGFNKEEIRRLSKKLGLITWDKPSLACLASRVPYGTKISSSLLKRIYQAECFLKKLGLGQVRLRHYNDLCRIEVLGKDILKLIYRRGQIVRHLKKLGYHYITLDLEGYRRGSMNEVIKNYIKKNDFYAGKNS